MDVFPIHPDVRYDYASRFNEAHHGIDIFAPLRSAVVAVEGGHAHAQIDPKGGTVIYLTGDSGARYYYAHLDEVVEPLDENDPTVVQTVDPGQIIGFVGTTGNAQGKQPHLHFQVNQPSLGNVDPFPLLQDVDPQLHPTEDAEPASESDRTVVDAAMGLPSTVFAIFLIWWLFKD